jgi:hypothetical protein
MPYRYAGTDTRTYTQFIDIDADGPLVASPGGTYDMRPAGQLNMPVPPGDGRWAPAEPLAAAAGTDSKTAAKTAPKTPSTSANAQ